MLAYKILGTLAAIAYVALFTATTPEQYVRFAAAVSFFAFVVGYDPTRFQGLLSMQLPVRTAAKGKQNK